MRKVMESNHFSGQILFKHPDEAFLVNSDENKIREILEQLIYNSLKYCRRTREIRVRVGHDFNFFYMEIKDNGFGIPDHEMPFIFKRFFRGEKSMDYSIDGDGLGLWVVKTYVDRLGGEIHPSNINGNHRTIEGVRFKI